LGHQKIKIKELNKWKVGDLGEISIKKFFQIEILKSLPKYAKGM